MNGSPETAANEALRAIAAGRCDDPHRWLGAHTLDGTTRLRAWYPDADACEARLTDGSIVTLDPIDLGPAVPAATASRTSKPASESARMIGCFEAIIPTALADRERTFRFTLGTSSVEVSDAYRFSPTLGELDLHLFGEGTHRRLWDVLGAHPRTIEGEPGVSFAVWAPNAQRVSVLGDFCGWDARRYPMRRLADSGVFEIFVPGVRPGTQYKYEILGHGDRIRTKTDPYAFSMQHDSGHASRVVPSEAFAWNDADWLARRDAADPAREPMHVYEVHLGSWRRDPDDPERTLGYREIAPRLAEHVRAYGFTHVELLPVLEHPYGPSWGYQVAGYYAPTSRHGSPDDFRAFVDHLHTEGIGVLLDWVPAHFPRDDFALRRFDGTALYEHLDPRLGEHPDWGTLIFNFGRPQVRNFLIANALYWLDEFHIDGLRVDAVASMLYLDYSRDEGQWIPNRYGGRENLEAIDFLKELNLVLEEEHPGCLRIAEESTAWPKVTASVEDGGLGFTFKWNMGWMHDTLDYFGERPEHRRFHHDKLTFAAMYEWSERFVMPLSHDEVVHGKHSLLEKMPGDAWQKFANLRLLLAYQLTRPGKSLWFMGTEHAAFLEWDHDRALEPLRSDDTLRQGFDHFVRALGALYRSAPSLWRSDPDPGGFRWIDCSDRDNSVVAYLRRDDPESDDGALVVVLNLTPTPHDSYRIGVPVAGRYEVVLDSDDADYGGSEVAMPPSFESEDEPCHGFEASLDLRLPPLAALVLRREADS